MSTKNQPVTENKLHKALIKFEKRIDEKLEIAIAQIVNAIVKSQANMATRDDIKNMVTKADIKNMATRDDIKILNEKIDKQGVSLLDIKRRIIDLEHDTPTQKEVDDLKKFVGFTKSF